MTDSDDTRKMLETSRDIISQLQEIKHYSQANLEKLSEFWLILDDQLKLKDLASSADELLKLQGDFQDKIEALINDFEIECNRIENEET